MKTVILFSHYNVDEITLYNYSLMKNHNIHDVIPLGFSCYDLIENSHKVDYNNTIWPKNDDLNKQPLGRSSKGWTDMDVLLYDFAYTNPQYDRYFLMEWDIYCNTSIEEFYGDALNMDSFGSTIKLPETNQGWCWFKHLTEKQKTLKVGGISGMGSTYYSKKVMDDILNLLLSDKDKTYWNMFCECRIGTLLLNAGYELKISSPNHWENFLVGPDYWIGKVGNSVKNSPKGYFHPIREFID
jgi:hypothetical protein